MKKIKTKQISRAVAEDRKTCSQFQPMQKSGLNCGKKILLWKKPYWEKLKKTIRLKHGGQFRVILLVFSFLKKDRNSITNVFLHNSGQPFFLTRRCSPGCGRVAGMVLRRWGADMILRQISL